MTSSPTDERIRAAIDRIARWMTANGAPLLPENLAPGATAERLARAETDFGGALPPGLASLWRQHDGQRDEGNGFFGSNEFLSIDRAIAQKEDVLLCLEFARKDREAWEEIGTLEELDSDHWLPFAGLDSDALAVHGVTGRVFDLPHDDSPSLAASSLEEWIERYAAEVEAGDYAVEEGFGDYFLARRDREREQREQERIAREAGAGRYRRDTPLLEQLRAAMATKNDARCAEVFEDALARNNREALDGAVTLLFGANLEPKFVASALRPHLRALTLAPDRWVDVAVGGGLLGNNAVCDIAVNRTAGASPERLEQLANATRRASGSERAVLDRVLSRVREKGSSQPPPPPPSAPPPPPPPALAADGGAKDGGWMSRWFGWSKRPPPKA